MEIGELRSMSKPQQGEGEVEGTCLGLGKMEAGAEHEGNSGIIPKQEQDT